MVAVDCAYEIEGQGPALYLVHGIGSRKTTWSALIPELKDHFTCVTMDLRGHGDSPVPPTPYALDDLLADIEALRARLGHDKIHIMGHSLGGMIAPGYARNYPDRVLSVGLLSTAAGRTEEDKAKLQAVGDAMEEKGVVPVLGTMVERWYTDGFVKARPDAIAARLKQVEDTPADVFKSVFWIYATTEMGPWLHQVKCPALVLTGEFDGGCTPRHNTFMAAELANSELVILDDLKHSIMIEGPERVVPHLRDFLMKQRQA